MEDLSWFRDALIEMTGIVPTDCEVEEFARQFKELKTR